MKKIVIIALIVAAGIIVITSPLPSPLYEKHTPWEVTPMDKEYVTLRVTSESFTDALGVEQPRGTITVDYRHPEDGPGYRRALVPFKYYQSSITEDELKELVGPLKEKMETQKLNGESVNARTRLQTASGINLVAYASSSYGITISTAYPGTSFSVDKEVSGTSDKPLLTVSESYYREF